MNVYVTGFPAGKKIHAIKAIRAATGLSLKDAKTVADHVEAGTREQITLADLDAERLLEEGGVAFQRVPIEVISLDGLINILGYYPAEMPVGDVIRVLRAAHAHTPGSQS